jgi:hypothetical protein
MTLDPRIIASFGQRATENAPALLARLAEVRIGLGVGPGRCSTAIGATVADQLVRVFPRLGAVEAMGKEHLRRAIEWAGTDAVVDEGPPDLTIVVGDIAGHPTSPAIFAGADGWRVYQSITTAQPTGALGLGAPAAGCLAVLAAFERIFADWIEGDCELPGEIAWSLFDWSADGDDPGPPIDTIDLGQLVWDGTGAVAHGAFWGISCLERVTGSLTLVDPDPHGLRSVERYAGARKQWQGTSKTNALRDHLAVVHPHLDIASEPTDLNRWYDTNRPECDVPLLVTTPDSKEARRHAAMKLPRTAVNGWAEGFEMGVEAFTMADGRCLGCAYPNDAEAVGEVHVIHLETELDPWRVQDLLDTADPLRPDEAARIAAKYQLSAEGLIGKPLRSVRQHLCAVGSLRPPDGQPAIEVPLGFVSAIAGIALLAEIVRLRLGLSTGRRWQWDARRVPTSLNAWPVGRTPNCFVCADDDFREIYDERYRETAREP